MNEAPDRHEIRRGKIRAGMQSEPEPEVGAADRNAITRLLKQVRNGDKEAFDRLMPLVYDQLRKLASRCLSGERPDHTLRATALVHEAYLKMADSQAEWQDRAHFYAVSARVMRHILVDHARGRGGRSVARAWHASN